MHDMSCTLIAAEAHGATLASVFFATLAVLPGFTIVWWWSHLTAPQRQRVPHAPRHSATF